MTSAGGGLTTSEKLLIAALDLDGGSGLSFTAEDLVVAAWRKFPRVFGLRGHNNDSGEPQFPDSNRVFAEIMGTKPVRKRGLLAKVGEKVYALTASGREEAGRLRHRYESPLAGVYPVAKGALARPVAARLQRLLSSKAAQRAAKGEFDNITFHDACVFWGLTPRSTSIELQGTLADVDSVIQQAKQAVASAGGAMAIDKQLLNENDVSLLRDLHTNMQEKFADEIGTISRRTDQRRA